MQACVSIIIPTYNRASLLLEVLPTYFQQKGVLEIIIVDDASSDLYDEVITLGQELEKKTAIHFYYIKNEHNRGLPGSRSVGLSMANGEYILWGEDDAFFCRDYSIKLLKLIQEQQNSFAFGSIYYGIKVNDSYEERRKKIIDQQKKCTPLFNYDLMEGYYRKTINQKTLNIPFGHALIMVPAQVYSKVFYDENYRGNAYREESDIQVQMLKLGLSALYTSEVECYHYPTKPNSGCHSLNRLSYELYRILNTFIFYDKHYDFLREKFKLPRSKFLAKFIYLINLLKELSHKIICKVIS